MKTTLRKKILFLIGAALAVLLLASGALAAPDAGAAKNEFSDAERKRMSDFLTAFIRDGFYNFEAKDLMEDTSTLVRFALLYNAGEEGRHRQDCPYCRYTVEGRYVTQAVKKFFDADPEWIEKLTEPGQPAHNFDMPAQVLAYEKLNEIFATPYYYDGELYHLGLRGDNAAFWAQVDRAYKDASGRIVMQGIVPGEYEGEDEFRGTIEAVAKPHKYDGKDTWAIVSLKIVFGDYIAKDIEERRFNH